MRPLPTLLLLSTLLLGASLPVRAQAPPPTTAEVYAHLAARCLVAVPDTAAALRLVLPEAMPYLAPPLIEAWQNQDRVIFQGDSARMGSVPTLDVRVNEARIRYARAGRGRVARTATLELQYAFAGPDGAVIRAAACSETLTDEVPRGALPALELAAYPETQAPPPPPGWPRRYLEPAVLTAATAVAVFLFFSLRSDRADDGL